MIDSRVKAASSCLMHLSAVRLLRESVFMDQKRHSVLVESFGDQLQPHAKRHKNVTPRSWIEFVEGVLIARNNIT